MGRPSVISTRFRFRTAAGHVKAGGFDATPLHTCVRSALRRYQSLLLLLPIFQTEITRARKGWLEPDFSSEASSAATVRTLRDGYTPGDLGFDPLGLAACARVCSC